MLRKYTKKLIKKLATRPYKPLNRIEIDQERLLKNITLIQRQHSNFEVIPVLKGNAYEHGIDQVAEILNKATCHFLAVDGYFEAARMRDITKHHILVMGHILAENIPWLNITRCSFVVQDEAGLHAFGKLNKPVQIHLELNTGMNRLGLQPSEISSYLAVLKKYPKLRLEGVMTHLADADNDSDQTFNTHQSALFDKLVSQILEQGFTPRLIHIAQTAGSAKIQSRYANSIRLGIGAYGINPLTPHDPSFDELSGLQPVLELRSTIIKILNLQKGDKVSYNCTFTAPRALRVGVLPLGYFEGLPRILSNKGVVTHNEQELPILGRICMDHSIIDLKNTNLQVNDEVVVISKNSSQSNSILGLQAKHGLFSYETLTGLSSTIRREIV